jgi:hypothetical protein
MLKRYQLLPKISKAFIWVTIIMICSFLVVYLSFVISALGMNQNSYECLKDSMMKIVCNNPYGSSIFWAQAVIFASFGWPLVIIWPVLGLLTILKAKKII